MTNNATFKATDRSGWYALTSTGERLGRIGSGREIARGVHALLDGKGWTKARIAQVAFIKKAGRVAIWGDNERIVEGFVTENKHTGGSYFVEYS